MVLLAAIDQGTSSSRFLVYEGGTGALVTSHQIEVKQYFPQPGWVEMDPMELYSTVVECIERVSEKLDDLEISMSEIKCVGLANQRETTVAWDRETGLPLCNAIVWLDSRTSNLAKEYIEKTETKSQDFFKHKTGLPIHPYFSALKIRWLFNEVPEVQLAHKKGTLMCGTVDSWLIWKLCGVHVTDVTNASRTNLLDLHKRKWSTEMVSFFDIPFDILPEIKSSAEIYGYFTQGCLSGIPLSGCLGDQQASMVGHNCLSKGDTKNTYGTGTFMLCNIGSKPVISKNGLITTVGFQFGIDAPVVFALEGSGSIGGNVIRFLRDNFGFIKDAEEMESLCRPISATQGVVFVPAFTGLYTPYWDSTARGTICGLTQYTTRAHVCLAALRAVCFQSAEMIEAVENDIEGLKVETLKIDGGMTANNLFNELQAEIMGRRIETPKLTEISGWGAAVAAGIGVGLYSLHELIGKQEIRSFLPSDDVAARSYALSRWKEAVKRACGWAV